MSSIAWDQGDEGQAESASERGRSGFRLAVLIVLGVVVTNIVAAILFERDPGLGLDEVIIVLVGVGLGALVEWVAFR